MFSQTVTPSRTRRAFLPSILLHLGGTVLVCVVWVASPLVEVAPRIAVSVLVPTRGVRSKPPRRAVPRTPRPPVTRKPVFVAPRVAPAVRVAVIPAPAPPPALPTRIPAEAPAILPPSPPPKPVVHTEVFAGIAPAPAPNPRVALTVETSGFLTAAPASAPLPREKSMKTGVFGAAETHSAAAPAPAKVTSAGFGAASVSDPAPGVSAPAVRSGGFASVAVQGFVSRNQAAPARSSEVEILSKPRPAYSEEARRRKIEGEVLVEVVFMASAKVRVLRVVQGLGHGMDEAAIQAAANIRFKPAERDGRPVDSPAIVRILFKLAY